MAPEQMEKPRTVDHRADIYSLGVVFYEMLTGELPMGQFPPPSRKVEVDVRLDEIVLRALAKEPEFRYQQVNEVKTRMETIAATPVSAPGASATQRVKRLVHWRRMLAVSGTALVLTAVGLVLVPFSEGKNSFQQSRCFDVNGARSRIRSIEINANRISSKW